MVERIDMILMVDDDPAQRSMTGAMLTAANRPWLEADGGRMALDVLGSESVSGVDLVLLDLAMPDMDGFELISNVRPQHPELPIIVLTASGSVSSAVAAIRSGASDFLIKPVSPEKLEASIKKALDDVPDTPEIRDKTTTKNARRSVLTGRNRNLTAPHGFANLVAKSDATRRAIGLAAQGARSDIPILIQGESGVGKEVFAKATHAASDRAEGPFVAVNCGALPANLIESILFGHEKGAFTGAVTKRTGKFLEADGGTLFLDEIGELPLEAQVKLLRVIQEGEVDPLGGSKTVKTNIRLISATNRDLSAEIAAGRFREDLYYRIGVFPLILPSLRERREDILPLATRFAERFAANEKKPFTGFTDEAAEILTNAPWAGNVRQLENEIHRALILSNSPRIGREHLLTSSAVSTESGLSSEFGTLFDSGGDIRPLAEIETDVVEAALARYGGSISEAARKLGIGRSTIYRKMRKNSIPREA